MFKLGKLLLVKKMALFLKILKVVSFSSGEKEKKKNSLYQIIVLEISE